MIWRYLIEGPWIIFVAYWAAGALKTRRTVSRESFASRCGVLFLEIVGFVLALQRRGGDRRSWSSCCSSNVRSCRFGRCAYLDGHRHRSVGSLAPGTILERQSHAQRGPQAHPHWALRSFPASHLFRNRSRRGRRSVGDRSMAMRRGSRLDRPGLLDQGEEGRVHAGRAIRGSLRRALSAHRFPYSEVLANRRGARSG
jgi:hypothetical protein